MSSQAQDIGHSGDFHPFQSISRLAQQGFVEHTRVTRSVTSHQEVQRNNLLVVDDTRQSKKDSTIDFDSGENSENRTNNTPLKSDVEKESQQSKLKGRSRNTRENGGGGSKSAKPSGGKSKPRKRPQRTNDEYETVISDLKTLVVKRNEAIEKRRKTAKGKNRKLDEAKHEINELRKELGRYRMKFAALQDRHDQLCTEQLDFVGKGKDYVQPDNIVGEDLAKVFRESKDWANTWAVKDWEGLSQLKIEQVRETLELDSFASQRAGKAVLMKKIQPKVILNAIINRNVCRFTLATWFSFLKSKTEERLDKKVEDRLQWIFNTIPKRSLPAAYRLRASIMREIAPPTDTRRRLRMACSENIQSDTLSDIKERHCGRILDHVLQQVSIMIKPSGDSIGERCKSQLLMIIRLAVDLSVQIHAQNPLVEFYFREQLENTMFILPHPLIEGHRALKLKETDEDNEQDARTAGILELPIDFVVEPAIVRSGDDKGIGYDTPRTLQKAVVWMVKPFDLENWCTNEVLEQQPPSQPHQLALETNTKRSDGQIPTGQDDAGSGNSSPQITAAEIQTSDASLYHHCPIKNPTSTTANCHHKGIKPPDNTRQSAIDNLPATAAVFETIADSTTLSSDAAPGENNPTSTENTPVKKEPSKAPSPPGRPLQASKRPAPGVESEKITGKEADPHPENENENENEDHTQKKIKREKTD